MDPAGLVRNKISRVPDCSRVGRAGSNKLKGGCAAGSDVQNVRGSNNMKYFVLFYECSFFFYIYWADINLVEIVDVCVRPIVIR